MTPLPTKHIVLVAGESSGDLHARHLVRTLKQQYPGQYTFSGLGGTHLAAEGVPILYDLAQFGTTGFTEVIKQLSHIRKAATLIKQHLRTHPTALLILIDYPGFNLRLAKFAKKTLHLPILYYISPQIWAWKPGRIHHIKRYVDHMAVILPFEKTIYDQAKVPCTFVGHPLLNTLPTESTAEARTKLQLNQQGRFVALLPGSRHHEIHQLLPIMVASAKQLHQKYPDVQFLLPIANTLSHADIEPFFKHCAFSIRLFTDPAALVLKACDAAIVASGTASLECALLQKPMCIIYKGSTLSYFLTVKVIRIKYLGLCNLIQNRMIVPELLQTDCQAEHLTDIIDTYLTNATERAAIEKRLSKLYQTLSQANAEKSLSTLVHELITKPNELPPASENAFNCTITLPNR